MYGDGAAMNDKLMHFCAGLLIALAVGWVFSPLVGLLAAWCAGAAKEFYDYLNPVGHSVEWLDFLATAAGGAVGSTLI